MKANTGILARAAERLHVQVQYQDQNAIVYRAKRVTHNLEWLHDAEAEELAASKGISLIDVEQMDGQITREVDDDGCVFIAARGLVVRIKCMTHTS